MQVGGKAKGLYALCELGLPVPSGFTITAAAYRDVVAAKGVGARIAEVLAQPDVADELKSAAIAALFADVDLPADLVSEIVPVKHPYQSGIRAQRGIEF